MRESCTGRYGSTPSRPRASKLSRRVGRGIIETTVRDILVVATLVVAFATLVTVPAIVARLDAGA